jgi:multidrug efflux pump subunit AcrA (membrane-fusion protein)
MLMNKLTNYIIKHSLKNDKQLKYDFMPSMLEIIEKPAHIGGKAIIYAIFSMLIVAVLWACFSNLDVVITANGNTKPDGDIQIVQSNVTGIVSEILVQSGQHVSRGDVLMVLGSEAIYIDVNQIIGQVEVLEIQLELYNRIHNDEDITELSLDDYDDDLRHYAQIIVELQNDYEANIENLELQKDNRELELQITQATIDTYAQNVRELIVQQRELAVEQAELSIENAATQHTVRILNQISEITQNLNTLNAQLERAAIEQENRFITSPVDGYIHRLDVNTIGAVVTTTQGLVSIVPDDVPIIMECFVKNMDISGVAIGDTVAIKLEAYPYSRYGTLEGVVTYISASSLPNEQFGSVFIVQVEISTKNENIDLFSGLSGSVEVHVGKRSVMSYFLDPIIRGFGEGLRER